MRDITLNYATVDETATAADGDFAATAGTLTFPVGGALTRTIAVTVNGDSADEGTESFLLALTGAVHANIGTTQGRGTILDDDCPTIDVTDVILTEGDDAVVNATFTISLSTAWHRAITVEYATMAGTALEMDAINDPGFAYDYLANRGTLTFEPGQTNLTVTVITAGDRLHEADETFFLDLSWPSNAVLGDGRGQATIQDTDPIHVNIGDAEALEGNSGTTDLDFVVRLTAAAGQAFSLPFELVGITAGVDSDVTLVTPSPLNIPAGATTATIRVRASGDLIVEGDETILLRLLPPTNPRVQLADQDGLGTIRTDDFPVAGIEDVRIVEGNGDVRNALFRVTLSQASPLTVAVSYSTSDGTATAGADYDAQNGILRFLPGETSKDVSIAIRGDAADEAHERFSVHLSEPIWALMGDADAQGTILDDESPIDLVLTGVTLPENNAIGHLVGLVQMAGLGGDQSMVLELVAGAGATDNDSFALIGNALYATHSFDYEVQSEYGIRIRGADQEGYSLEKAFLISVADVEEALVARNDLLETTEDAALVFNVAALFTNDTNQSGNPLHWSLMQAPAHGSLNVRAGGVLAYVPDADFHGTDEFLYRVNDGLADSNSARVTITILSVNDAPVAVDEPYSLDEDTALEIPAPGILGNDPDADGTSPSAVLVDLPAHGSVTLDASGRFVYQPTENYHGADRFTYRAFDGTLFSNLATVSFTIAAANDPPTANAGVPYQIEEGMGVTLNAGESRDVDGDSLTYAWDLDDDGQFDDAVGVTPTISWNTLVTLGLGSSPSTHTIALRVRDSHNAQAVAATTLTIVNSKTLTLSLAAAQIAENAGAGATTATVTRTHSDNSVALTIFLTSGDTTEAALPASVTIPAGQASATFSIDALDDALADGTQSVTIFATASGFSTGSATIQVTDHEILTVSVAPASVAENAGIGATTGTVTRSNTDDLSQALIVNISSADTSEATVAATVTIAAGTASATFAINAVDDALLDGPQHVTILATATGYEGGSAVVQVTDQETLTVSMTPASVAENAGAGAATGTVTRSNTDLAQALIVSLSSNDASEATVPATVTIPAGQSSAQFTINAVDDALLDGAQDVSISATAPAYVTGSAVLQVTDHETLSVSISASSVAENAGAGAAIGTVTRSNTDLGQALVVSVSSNDTGEATVAATVTIPAGQAFAQFPINVVDDTLLDGAQPVMIIVSANGYAGSSAAMQVTDHERLTVTIVAASVAENAGVGATTGTVTRTNTDVAQALVVNLSTSDTSELAVQATVTIPAGQVSVQFPVNAIDDALFDGTQSVTVSAAASGYQSGSAVVQVTDREPLTVSIAAASVAENAGVGATTGTVVRGNADLSQALVVNLSSNDTTEATVAATVTIPAGEASAQFSIDAIDDALLDGTQTVTISAVAAGYLAGMPPYKWPITSRWLSRLRPRAWPKTPAPARQQER